MLFLNKNLWMRGNPRNREGTWWRTCSSSVQRTVPVVKVLDCAPFMERMIIFFSIFMSPQRILCDWSIRQSGLCFNVIPRLQSGIVFFFLDTFSFVIKKQDKTKKASVSFQSWKCHHWLYWALDRKENQWCRTSLVQTCISFSFIFPKNDWNDWNLPPFFFLFAVSNWDFYLLKWIKPIWCNDDRITIEVLPAKECDYREIAR